MSYLEPTGVLDLPMEIIEYMAAYLSSEDLFNLSTIGPEILKRCSFNALRKKESSKRSLCSMCSLLYQNIFDSLNIYLNCITWSKSALIISFFKSKVK